MYWAESQSKASQPVTPTMSYESQQRWIDRACQGLAYLKEAFPATPIRWRTLHPLWPGTEHDFWNDLRVAQMNAASVQVSAISKVPLLDLGRILLGQPTDGPRSIMKDKVHMSWYPGLYMYAEMVLHYLLEG
jgi:hypothetical protein